jgi:hypothetical protein
MYHKLRDLKIKNIYNCSRDFLFAIILLVVVFLGKDISDCEYFWIIAITFLALSIVNAVFLSWDRINPEIFIDYIL